MGRTLSVRRHSAVRRAVAAAAAIVTGATLALASAGAVGPVGAASADTRSDKNRADAQVQADQDALEGTSTQLVQAYQAYQATTVKVAAAQRVLDVASAEQLKASQANDAAAAKLQVAQADEARATDALATTEAQLTDTQDNLDSFAADVFQGDGGGQLSVALGATSADDFASRLVLADTVTSLTTTAISELQNARAEDDAQKAYLTSVRVEIDALKQQAAAALVRADQAKAVAAQAKASLVAVQRQQAGAAATLAARKKSETATLKADQAEQAALQAMLVAQAKRARAAEAARIAAAAAARKAAAAAGRAVPASATYTPTTGGKGFFSYPANGPITSEFGMRFHPILHVWKLHSGTDFGIACGTPVYAAASGTVISAGWGGGDGNRIVIDHGIVSGVDLASTYNHLTSFVVRSGPVARGQLIAYSGTTGYSTGCHLHFEVLVNGAFVNPRGWI